MNIGLYQSAASLSALERWQDAVTQNISSGQVSGFKKRTVQFDTVRAGELHIDPRRHLRGGAEAGALFPQASYGISFQSGEVHPTGRDLDVALQGEGFFEVRTEDGQRVYTRNGAFHLRADRTLVTSDNAEVLSDGGVPLQLLAEGGSVKITEEGVVTQGETQIGRLAIVSFADPSRLLPTGGGTFLAPAGLEPEAVAQPQVLQGHSEASNVSSLREMVDLVNIARAYDANQRMIQARDQNAQRVLDTLG